MSAYEVIHPNLMTHLTPAFFRDTATLQTPDAPPAVAITASATGNPVTITTATAHGFTSGQLVDIAGHGGSVPDINGKRVVTVTGPTTFTLTLHVTVAGTGGTARLASQTATGQPVEHWSAVDGYSDIPCAVAAQGGSELRTLAHTYADSPWVVLLAGYYPGIEERWRVVVDGARVYDIQSVEPDQQRRMTRLRCREVVL